MTDHKRYALNRRKALVGGLAGGVALGVKACAPSDKPAEQTTKTKPNSSLATESAITPDLTDLVGQIDLVRSKAVKPSDLLEASIERIEVLNPKLNAVVTPCFDRARDQLKNLPTGTVTGGVPFLIKDLMDVKGVRTTYGSGAFKHYTPQVNDVYAKRIQDAGLLVIGKTNSPELGLLPVTEPNAYGATKNPWDLSRTPGGSSGGAAAAVASGMLPCAQGSDGGGSIRIPSHYCGLFGLKPSRHRVVDQYNRAFSISVAGVLSRTLRDTAFILSLCETSDDKRDFASVGLVSDPIDRPLKIALVMDDYFAGQSIADAQVTAAIEKTAKLCESLGHSVEPATPPRLDQSTIDAFLMLWSSTPNQAIKSVEHLKSRKVTDAEFEPWTQLMAQYYDDNGAEAGLSKAREILQAAERTIVAFLKTYDVVLSPVMPTAAHGLGKYNTMDRASYESGMLIASASVGYTAAYNVAGAPCMSMPLYRSVSGLPIGSQFIAAPGQDGLLLQLALQLEAAQPWIDTYPAL